MTKSNGEPTLKGLGKLHGAVGVRSVCPISMYLRTPNTLHWVLNPGFAGNADLNPFRISCYRRHTSTAQGLLLASLYLAMLHSLYMF